MARKGIGVAGVVCSIVQNGWTGKSCGQNQKQTEHHKNHAGSHSGRRRRNLSGVCPGGCMCFCIHVHDFRFWVLLANSINPEFQKIDPESIQRPNISGNRVSILHDQPRWLIF